LAKRRRQKKSQYKVRWAGWDEEHDTWESATRVDKGLIEEYEAPQPCGPRKPRKPSTPFVLDECNSSDKAALVDAMHTASYTDSTLSFVGARAAKALQAKQRAQGECRVLKLQPCDPTLYVALHRRLQGIAEPLDGEHHLTGIKALKGSRGGATKKDVFSVVSADLVDAIVGKYNTSERGAGALVLRPENKAMALAPPLEFTFEQKPDATPTCTIKAEFVGLACRPNGRPAYLFDRRFKYTPDQVLAYKQTICFGLRELEGSCEPPVPQQLRRKAHAQQ
jgi:hypothetical protein